MVAWLVRLATNPTVALVLAIVAAAGLIYRQGITTERKRHDAAMAKAQEQRRADIAEYVVDMSLRNAADREQHRLELGRLQLASASVIQQVPNYVTPKADAGCIVTRGFVQLHDDAAAGRMPTVSGSAGGSVDLPSGVPLSTVGAVVATNYGSCTQLAAEVTKWRAWFPREKAKQQAVPGGNDAKPGGLSQNQRKGQ